MSSYPSKEDVVYFADIILPLAIPHPLTYRIPSHIVEIAKKGNRAIVSLGSKKILTGIISKLHHNAPTYTTKNIIDILDKTPILNEKQLTFFDWISEYYMCTVGEVLKAALPSAFRINSESKIYLHPNFDEANTTLSLSEKILIDSLRSGKALSYKQAEKLIDKKDIYKLLKDLINTQSILLVEELQEKYAPKKEKHISLYNNFIQDATALQNLFEKLEKKPKQLDVLLQYMTLISINATNSLKKYFINKKKLLQKGISTASLQTLIQQEIFIEKDIIVSRLEEIEPITSFNPTLSIAQEKALSTIKDHFITKNAVLLHGVTGSGKTEIYTSLIQEALDNGMQVLYLVPEIGLATQIVQRMQKKIDNPIGVYHSKYDNNQRVEIWNKVLQEETNLIIGTRSALFLPFNKLKLIIVDEEHETAYKQLDTSPRYHARDAALMLSMHHQAKVLLGSATPSIETYYNARKDKYGMVQLTERFNSTPLPNIDLVNVRMEQQRKRMYGEFTNVLLEELTTTLQKDEQAIIFQNRRGYASYLLCQVCAWVPCCQQCSVSLTYHQLKDILVCHYCGYTIKSYITCQACSSSTLKNIGFGTEKIEEVLQQSFPDKRIQRMDLDTTKKKNSYEKIIASLENGQTNILVGTQMITKGLDFGKVSLVGVLDIDRLLYLPDFRANERCFQLITQVSGRAGRRDKQGKVIIQTTDPTHYILQSIVNYNYEQMYSQELLERQRFRYPPYIRLIKINLQHTNESLVKQAAKVLVQRLETVLDKETLLGPQAPIIAKIKQQYHMNIWIKLVKSTDAPYVNIKQKVQDLTKKLISEKSFRQTRIIFDVDPV